MIAISRILGKIVKVGVLNLEKVEALAATGMPGAYKVLIFFFIQKIHGLSALGNIAAYQSAAQILGYFTAIGWCSLILVRVPKEEKRKERLNIFNSLTTMGSITLFGITILLFLYGRVTGFYDAAYEVFIWLCAWTYYQLPRHYFVSQKRYRAALSVDVLVITGSLCISYFSQPEELSTNLAGFMLVSGLAAVLAVQEKKIKYPKRFRFELKGIEYGMVNLLTGGIALSLVPLASTLESETFAGALSMFIALTSVALLIPRAVSINLMPELAKNSSDHDLLKRSISKMQKQISVSNIFTTLFSVFVALYIFLQEYQLNFRLEALIIFLLIVFQSAISIQALTFFNALMVQEKSRQLLKLNATSFLVFLGVVSLLYSLRSDLAMVGISFTLVFLSAYRYFGAKSIALDKPTVTSD